jgi:hypothetical protein
VVVAPRVRKAIAPSAPSCASCKSRDSRLSEYLSLAGGRFGGDVSIPVLGIDRRVEVKCRGNGFRELYKWLDGADLLIVRADRRELLVITPLKLAAEIAVAAERGRTSP